MAKSYAAEVTVKRGSTILEKRYGGLGGDDGVEKDKLVKREPLLKAYEETIRKLGGKEDWIRRCKRLKKAKVLYIDRESKEEIRSGLPASDLFNAFGAKSGDVLAVLNPDGDGAIFQLRKVGDAWLVVAEFWD